jgi:hypothetical protein
MTRRLTLLLTLAASMVAGTAHAQFNRSDPATGEKYAVEIAYGWWKPTPTIQIASEGLGIPPTLIDFETDLGVESERVRELRIVLRPARKHKFKIDYLPISYEIADHVLQRTIVFNGQSYTVGVPVHVDAKFTTLKIGYEYDFLYKDRGYLGFILDTKITRARIDFDSPINTEFAEAAAFSGDKNHVVASFSSGSDLIQKTPAFWESTVKAKLTRDFGSLHRYLNDPYPSGPNEYVERIEANMARIKQGMSAAPAGK